MTYLKTVPLSMRVMRIAGLATALTWSVAGQAVAQDSKGPIDKQSIEILKGMSDYLSKEPTLSFRARTFFDIVQKSGIKVKMARSVEVVQERPGHLYAETIDEAGVAASIWYDGKKFTVWRRSTNEFMALEFPGTIDKLLDELTDKYEFQIPLADFLHSDVNKALGEHLISSEYIGLRNVDGVECHHISFESDGADWQIWIEADSTPVPRRFVIDYVTEKDQPQFMAQFDAWSLGRKLSDHSFTAVLPQGVKELEFRKDAAEGQAQ
jgi:hypothetical protein